MQQSKDPTVFTVLFEDSAAITGIGASKMGRRLMVPPLSLTIEACEAAVADAGKLGIQVAEALLAQGAGGILAEVYGS